MKVILILLLLITCVLGAPWLDLFFGRNPYYGNEGRHRQGKNGKERWKEICRTINTDGFAFPGQVPYPAAPACPW